MVKVARTYTPQEFIDESARMKTVANAMDGAQPIVAGRVFAMGTAMSREDETLTFADFLKLTDQVRKPKRYYATLDAVERGTFYGIEMGTPDEFYLFHPDDFERNARDCPDVEWCHVRDRKPTRLIHDSQ
jgi:hypothetical protein